MLPIHTSALRIVAGAVLLACGRRLFWFLVGVLGFLAGMTVAAKFLHGQPQMVHWAAAILLGILGALMAIFLQKVAICVAGFLAGGYAGVALVTALHLHVAVAWLPAVAGGVIGAVFGMFLFEWALVLFSSLTGAMLVAESVHVDPGYKILLFFVLFAIGFAMQAGMGKRKAASSS